MVASGDGGKDRDSEHRRIHYFKLEEEHLLPCHRREGEKIRTSSDVNIVVKREIQDTFLLVPFVK